MNADKMKNISSIPIDGFSKVRITSVWTFLQSVQWSEPWLICLISFHVLCFLCTILTCRYYRLQIFQFLLMVAMVYSAEYLNEIAAMNWRSFSKFQYFDSKGMFISLVYSVPLLFNTIIIVMYQGSYGMPAKQTPYHYKATTSAVWVRRTLTTMTELKTLQLKRKVARESAKKSQ